MDAKYAEYFETHFLRPIPFPNKEEYYSFIHEIGNTVTFFIGEKFSIAYRIVKESEHMLINAVSLFEKGYFDAAFYTLRQTMELCMMIAYFFELPDEERRQRFKDWKGSVERFPGVGEMRRTLESADYSVDFRDFKEKMPEFFDEFASVYRELNKYTHKQGLRYFYSVRWYKDPQNDESLLVNFRNHLDRVIGCVAIFRLMIDPLPVLKLEEEIEYRTADILMFPFSPRFVAKFIGDERLGAYKKTNLCSEFKAGILRNNEKLSEATYNYIKWDFLERNTIPEVLKQKHLLSRRQIVQLMFVDKFMQISAVHTCGGLLTCRTDVESKRIDWSASTAEFDLMEKSSNPYNQQYKGVYISVLNVQDESYFLEHNETIDERTIIELENFARETDCIFKARC